MQGHKSKDLRFPLFSLLASACIAAPSPAAAHDPPFTKDFPVEECDGFSSSGTNPYFVLRPGYEATYEGIEDGEKVRNVITVTDSVKSVNGVETRVVRERETHNGELAEISRNYFAICNRDNSVYYFGEDVDLYEDGKIVAHEGAWRAGRDGAHAGIAMPGTVLSGARYFQEVAPDVAMDRAEVTSLTETVKTPAGTFEDCVQTLETTPLEPKAAEYKWYAPGTGLVRDDTLRLVKVSGGP
jgi:hypothetical protein